MITKKSTPIIIIIMILMIVNSQTYAQEELDQANYKFYYDYTWQFDTIKTNDNREDLIILQVGQNISKSYSYYTFQSDSLKSTYDGENVWKKLTLIALKEAMSKGENFAPPPYYRRMGAIVYKNYPSGKMTITDEINSNHYIFTDELHPQNWQIIDSTRIILDYSCQMAVSDFRGRRWTAWFALDIPLSDGPWKLSGLPGLIMEAYDTKKHFHFTIVGIEMEENEPIVFSPVVISSESYGKYEKTTRIEYLRGLYRYLWNSSAFMNAEIGIPVFNESSGSNRHHDLIERDYK